MKDLRISERIAGTVGGNVLSGGIPDILLSDNNGIMCIDCKERHYHNEELVFDGDESKTVTEQYPDWAYARCVECQEQLDEATAEALCYGDPALAMAEQGYVMDAKWNTWIKRSGVTL